MPAIHIDGKSYAVAPDQSLLQACLSLGFHLPYFCWHPAMGSVGACRQCAVQHYKDAADPHGRLVMACMTPVAEGMRIGLAEPGPALFRKSVIEGLMLNHPHDCPVCDEGGQCHLQDMTVMAGHDYRRYRFRKRTFRNQYLGPFINHEMNRCIQCYRCVRFYREYAGGSDLEVLGIRDLVYFGRAQDGVLQSEFAGNLAEVCPTGVFTDATLKHHYTRKWDLRWTPSVCPHCSLGCNTSLGQRYGSVRVTVNRYHRDVNSYFLCDRGRYGYEYLGSPRRLRQAHCQGRPIAGEEAAAKLQDWITAANGALLGIGSPRASLESNFALRQLVGAENFYAGEPPVQTAIAARVAGLMRAGGFTTPSLRDISACDAVLILGEDLTQTAARMALAVRQAARQQPLCAISDPLQIPRWLDHPVREALQDAHGPVFIATPTATKLDDVASECFRAAPDDLARLALAIAAVVDAGPASGDGLAGRAAAALLAAARPLVIAGASLGSPALVDAAAALTSALAQRGKAPALAFVLPACNSLGLALLQPQSLDQALDRLQRRPPPLAIAAETDLFRCLPKPIVAAALQALHQAGGSLVALDSIQQATTEVAALALPAAAAAESDGTFISQEGRAQRFFQVSPPPPPLRASWLWLTAAQHRQPALDDLLAALAAALPELAPVRQAAPEAGFRLAQEKIPRETHRFSGRTAINAARNVSEPKPPADPDSPLSFTMEGYAGIPPAALTPFFWSPGWNSPQATLTYQREVNAELLGGPAGIPLFRARNSPGAPHRRAPAPPPFAPRDNAWLILPLPHLFGSEELSRLGAAIAQLVPEPYLGLHPEDARRLALEEGDRAQVELDDATASLRVRLMPELPRGLAAASPGIAPLDAAILPAWGRIRPSQEGPS